MSEGVPNMQRIRDDARPESIEVRGVQGAGDSLVAGMCMAIQQKLDLANTLRYAVAVANGSLILEGTKMCTRENFDFMLPRIDVSVME